MKTGQPRPKDIELDGDQQQGCQRQQQIENDDRPGEEPTGVGIDLVEYPFGVDPAPAQREHVGELAQQLASFLLVAAFPQLMALPDRVGHDQAAAVQHADELLQILIGDLLGVNSCSNRSLMLSRLLRPSSMQRMAYSSSWNR